MMLGSAIPGRARADATQTAIRDLLTAARPKDCYQPADALARILCAGVLRVGVRAAYPGFGLETGGTFKGFEIDMAAEIARRLEVGMAPVSVTPANRIPLVAAGTVDLVIATMTDTVTRAEQIDFIRPHYYASHTSVIGPRKLSLPAGNPLGGRTVCVPLGAAFNILLGRLHARLLIFDQPARLIDALRFDQCQLAAHDDSFFAFSMADPEFAARFEEKVAFSPEPWGIGIARRGTARLNRLLSLIVTDLHRSGTLIGLADKHTVSTVYLREQQTLWSGPNCVQPNGEPVRTCTVDPMGDADTPASIAPLVLAAEAWTRQNLGVSMSFTVLKGQYALRLFADGIVNTLALVLAAIGATAVVAMVVQALVRQRGLAAEAVSVGLVTLLQFSPVMLLLVLAYSVFGTVENFSATTVIGCAAIAIGLINGSAAGAAIAEAARTLTPDSDPPAAPPPMRAVLARSAKQIARAATNAVHASAVASFIGTPELVNTLNNIASITAERTTTFTILLLFYTCLVAFVAGLARLARRWLERGEAAV